jgi:hypothetical protein
MMPTGLDPGMEQSEEIIKASRLIRQGKFLGGSDGG